MFIVSRHFAIFVPSHVNFRLSLDGEENHKNHNWNGQGTSRSLFNASKMSFLWVRHPLMFPEKILAYPTHTFHDGLEPQILWRASTSIAQHGCHRVGERGLLVRLVHLVDYGRFCLKCGPCRNFFRSILFEPETSWHS